MNYFRIWLLLMLACMMGRTQAQFIVAGTYSSGDVYTDIDPDSIQHAEAVHLSLYPVYIFEMDLDKDGVPDLKISSSGGGGLAFGSAGCGIGPLQTSTEILAYQDTFTVCCPMDVVRMVATEIDLHDTITDGRYTNSVVYIWSDSYGISLIPHIPNWVDIGEHFIGFRLAYTFDTLYGWIRINVTNSGVFKIEIKDYACNRNNNIQVVQQDLSAPVNCYMQNKPGHYSLEVNSNKSDNAEIILSDMLGRIIFSRKIQIAGTGMQQFPIDISALGNAVYLLTVRGKEWNETFRLFGGN